MTANSRPSVEARGELVVLTLGSETTTMSPHEAQSFAFWLARAYCRAGDAHRGRNATLTIGKREPSGSALGHVFQQEREVKAC